MRAHEFVVVVVATTNVAEGLVKLYRDPDYFGAEVDDTGFDRLPVVDIPVDRLQGFQPETDRDRPQSRALVKKMVASLKRGAVLPPILVRKVGDGYQVLDGHHRFWAYRLSGTRSVPAQIVPAGSVVIS